MTWTLRSTVAAVVAIGVVLGVMTLTQQRATAAEQLVAATQKSKAFKGWVHRKFVTAGVPGYGMSHFNNETGVSVSQMFDGDGGLELTMDVPGEKKEMTYNSKTGVLKIGGLWATFAEQWKKSIEDSPLTFAENFANSLGASVKQFQEGKLNRFEITWRRNDPTTMPTATRGAVPETAIVWADAATGLVTKAETTMEGKLVTTETSYGAPEIKDVFDLGVPRTASVVDVRPTKDVNALLEQLAQRYRRGFGDYTAVETESDADKGTEERYHNVILYGQAGKAFISNRYHFEAKALAGWPTPELKTALDSVRDANASMSSVSDGTTSWNASWRGGVDLRVIETKPQGLELRKAIYTLPGNIWPTREKMGLFGTDAAAVLLTDVKRPGLVGLKMDEMIHATEEKMARIVNVYWMDPAKDDVPVETLLQRYAPEKDEIEYDFHTTYSSWAQTASGRWYPSAWRVDTRTNLGKKVSSGITEHRLQVWEGEKLGAEWFTRPQVKPATVK